MENVRKEVLLVTRNLPPLIGGMESLLFQCAKLVEGEHRLTVVGPRGCGDSFGEQVTCYEAPDSLVLFLLIAPFYCVYAARRKKFDVVIGGSGLVAPCLWMIQKLFAVPSVCFVHGLDIVVSSRVYQMLFTTCLKRMSSIIANSENTRSLCIDVGIDSGAIEVIHPGCRLPEVDRLAARSFLDETCRREDAFYLLSVGRIIPRKGLLQFMRAAFAGLLEQRPETVLVIVGEEPTESLAHRSPELQGLVQLVQERGWQHSVCFMGRVNDETLTLCYGGADCLLFPLIPVSGDVEGFGMVAIEAAAHGIQTVAFAEGGVVDAVDTGSSGFLIDSGDYQAMVQVLAHIQYSEDSSAACREHASRFTWDIFGDKLLAHLGRVVNKG